MKDRKSRWCERSGKTGDERCAGGEGAETKTPFTVCLVQVLHFKGTGLIKNTCIKKQDHKGNIKMSISISRKCWEQTFSCTQNYLTPIAN